MSWILGIIAFLAYTVVVFLFGANNPPKSIERKIVAKAQAAIDKIKKA